MALSLTRPARLDRLSCVNVILQAAGEDDVSTLGDGATVSALEAANALAAHSNALQSEGWSFCSEESLKLEPTSDGSIYLPENLMSLAPTPRSGFTEIQDRGGRLYDRAKSTFKFDNPVYVRAVLALPFDELPQQAAWLVTLNAAVAYISGNTPGDASLRVLSNEAATARALLEQYDAGLRPGTLADKNPHFHRIRRKH
ncbi:hypothetical protein IB276_22485 [Ensifer sp. ENS04]|uniref:hypothetical protein n=1 Tax=Ensifer sp. ENS04 TaxID=2769281 RepID=UPI0017812E62|nr:hypothetical protein [Ensifer sp. ENS04]MBD9542216.1 hypothetical protein [Ensifer sp. ENS04]